MWKNKLGSQIKVSIILVCDHFSVKQTLPPALSIILSIPQFLSAPRQYCVGKSYELSALEKYMLFLLRSPVPKTSCRAPPVPLHPSRGFSGGPAVFLRRQAAKIRSIFERRNNARLAICIRGWWFPLVFPQNYSALLWVYFESIYCWPFRFFGCVVG